MTRVRFLSCLLAAALLLPACAGVPGESSGAPSVTVPADPGAGAPAAPAPSPAPSTGQETGPGSTPGTDAARGAAPPGFASPGGSSGSPAGAGDPEFSSARLEAAVAAANRSLALDGQVLSEAALRAVLPDTEAAAGTEVTFEPAACAEIAATASVSAVQDASLAGLAYGTDAGAASVLNVAAYADESILDTLDYIDEAVLSDCAEVRMAGDGATVTVTNTRLEVTTAAEHILALDTAASSAAGNTRLVVVSARTGNVRLVASRPAPRDAQRSAEEAGLLIDAVLAELGLASR
ncbi:hypothetical protein [Arthrobacter sp. IK3]|uniref:hypothetical protein n=1 Tax=Arthrobacter sp. IK3 TaxID=3448169 RepID=UPI003EE1A028